jgi:hypothetical protein
MGLRYGLVPQLWEDILRRIPLSLLAVAVVFALAGCASSRKQPYDDPRTAKVLDWRVADRPEEQVMIGIHSGMFGVFGGLQRHFAGGGSAEPASVGPAVGGLVEDGKKAANDNCANVMNVEFTDDKKQLRIFTRCDSKFTAGQMVSVVRNRTPVDSRDVLRVTALQ